MFSIELGPSATAAFDDSEFVEVDITSDAEAADVSAAVAVTPREAAAAVITQQPRGGGGETTSEDAARVNSPEPGKNATCCCFCF